LKSKDLNTNAGRVLGLDYGSKRVGVAVSDPFRVLARGVDTLDNGAQLFKRLEEIIRENEIDLIVVGMPYAADGGKGKKASEVDEFIARLKQVTEIRIDTWDESYSSVNAQQAFIDGGMRRKQRRQKARVDEMAARLILQDFLDHHTT
jgi:putative holliday junction resolvase